MNTEIKIHPKLHHIGLVTTDMDVMTEWYGKVLGMTVNHRSKIPMIARITHQGPPFAGFAFVSNDEMDHRIVFFEIPKAAKDSDRFRRTGLQHIAFECENLDDLLGTYIRLKKLGTSPLWAADHGVGISVYYEDPDRNVVELFLYNYGNPWTATEFLRAGRAAIPAHVDLDRMLEARKSGTSPWDLHERAMAGDFAPAKPFDPHTSF